MTQRTLTATYHRLDGTIPRGSVHARPCVRFYDADDQVTRVDPWVSADLDADGTVTLTVDDLSDTHQLAGVYLEILEQVEPRQTTTAAWPLDLASIDPINDPVDLGLYRPADPSWRPGDVTVVSVPGPQGPPGPPGGAVVSGWWAYQPQTVIEDPGPGNIRTVITAGTGAIGDTISVALHHTDADGVSWTGLDVLSVGDTLILRDTRGDQYALTITLITPGSGWTQVEGTLTVATGSAPQKNTRVQVSVVP